MAFVNELIPEDAKNSFDFPVQVSRATKSKPTLWKWTVDQDRGVFLVKTRKIGGAYEGTPEETSFVMMIGDQRCEFSALSSIQVLHGVNHLTWNIVKLCVSESLAGDVENVKRLITEALDAMGLIYDRSAVATVTTLFECSVER